MSRPPLHLLDGRTWSVKHPGRRLASAIGVARPCCAANPSTRRCSCHSKHQAGSTRAIPSWQITAATLVGLMSVPGLAVLYGGVMQKRWSINSMMLTFATFSIVLVVWVLWAFKMGFGTPFHGLSHSGFFGNFIGKPGPVLSHTELQHQANIPLIGTHVVPAVRARLLPVRVRGDHADPGPRVGARARQLQGVDPVLRPVDHVRLRGRRVPAVGRRLLRPARSGRLLRWLRDPPVGRRRRIRRGLR